MAERQPVRIQYRRLDDVRRAFGANSLETAIRQAMNTQITGGSPSQHWKQRAWEVPPDGGDTILMNLFHDNGNYFFGDLTLYSAGKMQALIESGIDAPSLDVEQEPAPDGKEYVNSLMYWFVAGDHVLILPTRALGSGILERYLSWLLGPKTEVIGSSEHVILKAEFTAAEVGGNLRDVREIIVGNTTPVSTEEARQAVTTDRYQRLRSTSSWNERAVAILRSIMRSEADVERLLHDIPEQAQLRVSVHIGYRDRRREVTSEAMQRALRNLPEGEITAKGRDGRVTGNDIRLSYPATIAKNGSLLRHEDVLRAFEEAYQHFRLSGQIQA
jgi:hypothetical protein